MRIYARKKIKQASTSHVNRPTGFQWDKDTYSCAYNSLFSILLQIKNQDQDYWTNLIDYENAFLTQFQQVFLQNHSTPEEKRDQVRQQLCQQYPFQFVFDQHSTDVRELCTTMLSDPNQTVYKILYCRKCKTGVENGQLTAPDIWYCSKVI